MLPLGGMVRLLAYASQDGKRPFTEWFERLEAVAAARVTIALVRMEQGNFGNVKGVGSGVYESKIDFGPGYRIYFGKDGETLVILLGGGTKKRQSADIRDARVRWADYKSRKKQEIP